MQGPVRFLHRDFFRRSHDATLRHAYARGEGPPPRRAEGRARRFRPRVPGPDRRRGTGGAAVNFPTSGYPHRPRPRGSDGESAPRGTQDKTQSLPFAAIPHDIAADPRLSPTGPRCARGAFSTSPGPTPAGPATTDRRPGPSPLPGTVRRSLRHQEDLGYIRRHRPGQNPTGRLIQLTCREPDWVIGPGRPQPVGPAPQNGGGAPPQTGGTRMPKKT